MLLIGSFFCIVYIFITSDSGHSAVFLRSSIAVAYVWWQFGHIGRLSSDEETPVFN